MKTSIPRSVAVPALAATAGAVEAAALAIGRLDARYAASPVAKPWALRAAWTGYARSLQLQGLEIDEIDVFSWGCGLPLPSRPYRASNLDEFAAFASWRSGLADGAHSGKARPPFSQAQARDRPRLLAAIDRVHDLARRDGTTAPWLTLPEALCDLGLTCAPLPCLVAGAKAFRWRATLSDQMVVTVLHALTAAAVVGLERLETMEADRRRAVRAVIAQHRPGLLPRLAALIASCPLVSPQGIADAFGISVSGAGKLLARSTELDLLVEVSGRKAWRLYLVPDFAITFGFKPAPRGRPHKEPAPSAFDRSLEDALAAFDTEMAAFDAEFGDRLASTA